MPHINPEVRRLASRSFPVTDPVLSCYPPSRRKRGKKSRMFHTVFHVVVCVECVILLSTLDNDVDPKRTVEVEQPRLPSATSSI